MGKKLPESTVLVFAKTLESGTAKSRIARTQGKAIAANIYLELLKKTAQTVAPFHYHLAYTGAPSPGDLTSFFPQAQSCICQQGSNLGERLHRAFTVCFKRGYKYICAIGTDCPYLTPREIETTFHNLGKGIDTVIGPAVDGGYYLIGCHEQSLDVLNAKQWSTAELFAETMAIITAKGFSYHLLRTFSDIDYYEDYRAWKNPLKSRAAQEPTDKNY